MPRYLCTVEYDGAAFAGWQRQLSLPTVQGTLEEAIFGFTGERVTVHAAGRTDAGVHAEGQVFHVDTTKPFRAHAFRQSVNALARPHPVCVTQATMVGPDFHARFSARKRAYRYEILNRRAPSVLHHARAWHVPVPLDVAAMRRAAADLIGFHDFSSFRDAECQAASAEKTLDILRLHCRPAPGGEGHLITLETEARSFLHHMVRNITGTLVFTGLGKFAPDAMPGVLAAKNRAAAGPTAPACGLTFVRAEY